MKTVCVYEAPDYSKALSAKELLDSFDIITLMPNEHHAGLKPYMNIAIGYFRLFVKESDFDKASEILEAYMYIDRKNHIALEVETSSQKNEKCPSCGSINTEDISIPRRFIIFILYLMGGIPIELRKTRKHCRDCNHHWKN